MKQEKTVSNKTKGKAENIASTSKNIAKTLTAKQVSAVLDSATNILGKIYNVMIDIRVQDIRDRDSRIRDIEQDDRLRTRRNDEIVKALSVRFQPPRKIFGTEKKPQGAPPVPPTPSPSIPPPGPRPAPSAPTPPKTPGPPPKHPGEPPPAPVTPPPPPKAPGPPPKHPGEPPPAPPPAPAPPAPVSAPPAPVSAPAPTPPAPAPVRPPPPAPAPAGPPAVVRPAPPSPPGGPPPPAPAGPPPVVQPRPPAPVTPKPPVAEPVPTAPTIPKPPPTAAPAPVVPILPSAAKVALGVGAVTGTSAVMAAIKGAEGGGNYDITFGDVKMKDGSLQNRLKDPKTKQFLNLKTPEQWSEETLGKKKKLTEMKLSEVLAFQKYRNNTWSSSGAAGSYGFMPSTLFGKDWSTKASGGIVGQLGLSMDTIFDKETQDKLAVPLLEGNLAYLKKNGVPTTPGWAYMSWYIGMGGATAVWNAIKNGQGNKKISEILDAAKINWGAGVNPELGAETFKGGMKNTADNFPVLLEGRLKEHGGLHMSPQGEWTVGEKIGSGSKENKNLKNTPAQETTPAPIPVMSGAGTPVKSTSGEPVTAGNTSDDAAYLRKQKANK